MAVLPDPFSIFPKGVWARDYTMSTLSSIRHFVRITLFIVRTPPARCPREMGTPQFGDPRPHIPSDMGTGGGSISLGIWGPGVPRTLVIWGSVGDLGTQGFCSIHNLRRHVRTNCMCKSKNMSSVRCEKLATLP